MGRREAALAMTASTKAIKPSEVEVATDLVRRGLIVAPLLVLVAGLVRGVDGAYSAAVAIALVLCNFVIAASSLAWAARRGAAVLAAVVFGGYALRLAIVVVVFLALRNQAWFDAVSFGVTLVVTHVGLLFWETRFVGLTLAAPGLRPGPLPEEN